MIFVAVEVVKNIKNVVYKIKIMIYQSVGLEGFLCTKSKSPYIGNETLSIDPKQPNIKMYWSKDGYSLRLVYVIGKKHVSVIQIMIPDKFIKYHEFPHFTNAYCLANYRRKGYSKQLFMVAKTLFKDLTFSNNLSSDGSNFVQFCKTIK